jgi:ribonucleoside-diphosphate reductase alpha chain
MRALQFAGQAMEVNNARGYNCAYHPIDSLYGFSETMFLLLGGSGVGYSVQKHHVDELPAITKPGKKRHYLIEDSIMGWADAVKVLFKAYLEGKNLKEASVELGILTPEQFDAWVRPEEMLNP